MSAELRDLLREAVADASPDLAGIGARARRQGLAIRRGRQLLGIACVAALAALALVVPQLLGGATRGAPAKPPAPSVPPFQLSTSGPLGPLTGPGAVEALFEAVGEVTHGGSADQFEAQSTSDGAYAGLTWTPADGSGWFMVQLDVQPGFDAAGGVYTCTARDVDCSVRSLPDGAVLKVAEQRTPDGAETGRQLTVDLLRADGTRVAASATNGRDLGENRWEVTRPAPGLTAAQLQAIVEQPVFGPKMPARYDAGGRQLPYLKIVGEGS